MDRIHRGSKKILPNNRNTRSRNEEVAGTLTKEDVERYITEFKGWAHLSGFDEIALVDQFKRGLKPALGRRVIETGNPGDRTTPGDLQKWYDRTTELERAFRESTEFFRRKEFTFKQKIRLANAQVDLLNQKWKQLQSR